MPGFHWLHEQKSPKQSWLLQQQLKDTFTTLIIMTLLPCLNMKSIQLEPSRLLQVTENLLANAHPQHSRDSSEIGNSSAPNYKPSSKLSGDIRNGMLFSQLGQCCWHKYRYPQLHPKTSYLSDWYEVVPQHTMLSSFSTAAAVASLTQSLLVSFSLQSNTPN